MKIAMLLLMPLSAHAHIAGPDAGLHHALPALFGLVPLLNILIIVVLGKRK